MTAQTVKRFMEVTREYWELLPLDYRNEVQVFVKVLQNDFTPIHFINANVPAFWLENKDIMDGVMLFLKHLTERKNVTLTPEKVKAISMLVDVKTKEPEKIIETFYNSVNRDYTRPYVVENDSSQGMLNLGLPTALEIKSNFQNYFKGQTISDKLITTFQEYNSYCKDNPKLKPFMGNNLSRFLKELAKITETFPGKVFTALKYLTANETTELPLDYSVILTWYQNQNNAQ